MHFIPQHRFRCARCGGEAFARRSDALYCSAACKQAAYRRRERERAAFTRDAEAGRLAEEC